MESKVAKNTPNSPSLIVNLSGDFVAIKSLLQQQLVAVMNSSSTSITLVNLLGGIEVIPEMIPMHRLSDDTFVLYRSMIAFKLAPLWQLPAFEIANQLVESLLINTQNTSSEICLDFRLNVMFPGWINFWLCSQGLATWLQQSLQTPPKLDPGQLDKSLKKAQGLFPVQYAHARCCSILRLAHQQDVIQLRDLEFRTSDYPFLEPQTIPWLDNDQETTTQRQLRLTDSAERVLITQLLDWQDSLNPQVQSQVSLVKAALGLSKAFEGFYSGCRIFGAVRTQTPLLAQARLGLVAVTQSVLRSLLEDQLGVPAPREL